MKILVTGGAGFIGSHLADAYIRLGHEVVVIDNLSSGKREQVPEQACFIQLDIRDAEVEDVFQREKFDAINHHAAQMSVTRSVANPILDADINILGSLNLLQLAVKYKVGRLLFASTGGAIYGEQETFPASESHPRQPTSPYGLSKLAVENYLGYYRKTFGLSASALRYSNVYGPRQDPHGEAGVVAIFCKQLKCGERPRIFGDGEQTRDFVSVRDVVQANVELLASDLSGAFNIGTGQETSVNTLAEVLIRHAAKTVSPEHLPERLGEQKRSAIDYGKIQRALGWHPRVTLAEGLGQTFDYFLQQP